MPFASEGSPLRTLRAFWRKKVIKAILSSRFNSLIKLCSQKGTSGKINPLNITPVQKSLKTSYSSFK
jgi:hypothetical protein